MTIFACKRAFPPTPACNFILILWSQAPPSIFGYHPARVSMSSNLHHRRGGGGGVSSHAASSRSASNSHGASKAGHAITDSKKLALALNETREKALFIGLTAQQFQKCVERASKRLKVLPSPPAKSSRCGRVIVALKVIWLLFLMLLALAMMSAAVKPVMFFMHKVHMHTLLIKH